MMIKCQELLKFSHDLLYQEEVKTTIEKSYQYLCDLAVASINHQISIPCHLAGLDYLHAMTSERSSAYIIQAQRDYFGAHTYQRIDDPSGKAYHTIW
jgi:6-phosphogluconate dehydrogenase